MLKKSFFLILSIFILFVFFSCKKNSKDENKKFSLNTIELKNVTGLGVVNENRLRLRGDSDLHSKTLRFLDKGEIVKILQKGTERVRIDEMEDYWYQIEFSGIEGWVFGHFLDIYTDSESANLGSSKYLKIDSPPQNNNIRTNKEEVISGKLFFLSNGKIYQLTNYTTKKIDEVIVDKNAYITNFYFTNNKNVIYYISKNIKNTEENGDLFSYDFKKKESKLILKSIYSIFCNPDSNIILLLSINKKIKEEFWVIQEFDISTQKKIKDIAKINKFNTNENFENDPFAMTLNRELGCFAHLEWDKKKNVIYFKPPEENQTYVISGTNNTSMKVDIQKSNVYNIDDSRFLAVSSGEDASGSTIYAIILQDKITGEEKEIIRSNLFPINFKTSPKQNYVAISMIDMTKSDERFFQSNIYILSLESFAITTITKDNISYQPDWSYFIIK
jgi:hypothetical protein